MTVCVDFVRSNSKSSNSTYFHLFYLHIIKVIHLWYREKSTKQKIKHGVPDCIPKETEEDGRQRVDNVFRKKPRADQGERI